MAVYTIGHSTRTLGDLVGLLRANGVTALCDVRSYPGSRHVPQWNKAHIAAALPEDISYVHLPLLGGRRRALPAAESVNNGWRKTSFRGYADYMQTDMFEVGMMELMSLQRNQTTAIMCSEAVPWRCHRSMISDALLARGIEVQDIITTSRPASMTPFAQVQDDGRITYPVQYQTLVG